jgi:nucleoside-diphosphate-sugar epimerase
MSVQKSDQTLVITGITGYLASVLGYDLLTKGYTIRGTSRSFRSAKSLLEGPYAPFKDRVKIYEVPDITVDGAFDNVVRGKLFNFLYSLLFEYHTVSLSVSRPTHYLLSNISL